MFSHKELSSFTHRARVSHNSHFHHGNLVPRHSEVSHCLCSAAPSEAATSASHLLIHSVVHVEQEEAVLRKRLMLLLQTFSPGAKCTAKLSWTHCTDITFNPLLWVFLASEYNSKTTRFIWIHLHKRFLECITLEISSTATQQLLYQHQWVNLLRGVFHWNIIYVSEASKSRIHSESDCRKWSLLLFGPLDSVLCKHTAEGL